MPDVQRRKARLARRSPDRLCGATTRRGTACLCRALANGRCKLHGGLSTGPKTAEGWERTREGYRAWLARLRAEAGQT